MRTFIPQENLPRISEEEAEKLTAAIQDKIAKNAKFGEVHDTEPRNAIFFALHDGLWGRDGGKCPADSASDPDWWGMFTKAGDRRVGAVVRAQIAKLNKLAEKRKQALFGKRK